MERNKLLLQILKRLAELEKEQMTTDIRDQRYTQIGIEMKSLRLKYQDVMNSACPLIKDL